MVPVPHRVVGHRRELADTVTLELEPVGGEPVPVAPGQFAMLWAFGVGEVPISYAGLPGAGLPGAGPSRGARHTIRAVGATTRALCDAPEGSVVGVRGPFGTGWPVGAAEGHDVVVVAGGIGLAPLRPLVDAIASDRGRYGRVWVLVGARSPDQVLYPEDVRRWSVDDVEVAVTVDHAPTSWTGEVGVVTGLVSQAHLDPTRTRAFVCGPEPMMRLTARLLVDRGVPPEHVSVSLERSMTCAVAHCGRCQLGPDLVCRDGPVTSWARAATLVEVHER